MLGFGLVVAIVIVVAAVGNYGMKSLNASTKILYETHAVGLAHLKDAHVELLRTSRAVRNAILDGDEAAVRRRISDIARFRADFRTSIGEFHKSAVLPANREKAEKLRSTFDALAVEQDKILAFALEQKDKEARAGIAQIREVANAMEKDMEDLAQAKLDLMKASYADSEKAYDSARNTLMVLALIAAGAALGLGTALGRIIGRPLVRSVGVLNAVAEGDFTQSLDIDSKDEVGQMATALNQAIGEIRGAMTGIRERTGEVASASRELASASEELASGAQEQASSLEETSASLEQITATVKQNADNARLANQLAAGSRESAEKGGRIVGSTQTAMGEINASSKRIADIILTVDEIAFQTNLLALNAAVEAARAGEQGRGFAVVAGEVRSLAQRAAVAAKEIKSLIQDSVRKVDTGTGLVKNSGETLEEIVSSVKRVTDVVSEIAAASSEQATGISQVSQAMAQMDKVTQSNTAQTEELSATAQTLSQQAARMQELVQRFKLGDDVAPPEVRRETKRRKPIVRRAPGARHLEHAPMEIGANDDLAAIATAHGGGEGFQEY